MVIFRSFFGLQQLATPNLSNLRPIFLSPQTAFNHPHIGGFSGGEI